MFSDARNHAIKRIEGAEFERSPFPYLYLQDIFPTDFHDEIQRNLPQNHHYTVLADMARVGEGYSRSRLIVAPINSHLSSLPSDLRHFWQQFFDAFTDDSFVYCIFNKFAERIEARFSDPKEEISGEHIVGSEIALVRDLENYSLGPHTDMPKKLMSGLFYLASDSSHRDLGTALYTPKVQGATCIGTAHHKFADFTRVETIPYEPNSFFGFAKSRTCFHGVEPVEGPGTQRDVIQFDLKAVPAK